MSAISDQDWITNVIRTSQIIVGALIAGVLTFVAIAFMVDLRPNRQAGVQAEAGANAGVRAGAQFALTDSIITYTAVAFAAVLLPLSFVVPNLVTRQSLRAIAGGLSPFPSPSNPAVPATGPQMPQTETGKLAALYSSNLIIGAALNEGLTFFAAMAYLIEKNPIALGLSLLLIAVLIARFPTAGRVERWIEQQREKLRDAGYRARSSY
ncbi:MAG: hypothetical protein ACHRXM_21545 [Isosphaerales bacterium]